MSDNWQLRLRRMLAATTLAAVFGMAIGPAPANASCNPPPTGGDDVITCDAAADTVNAGNGNDTVYGNGGDDRLTGGNGDDTLDGGNGNDRLTGSNGDDILDGGSGADYLYGNNGDDTLLGGNGNDRLYGHANNDTLIGGAGNDTYYFDTDTALGADVLTETAGGGTDLITFSGSNNDITLDLSLTGLQVVNSNLSLELTAPQVENLTGGNGNDVLTGNDLANTLRGGNGTIHFPAAAETTSCAAMAVMTPSEGMRATTRSTAAPATTA